MVFGEVEEFPSWGSRGRVGSERLLKGTQISQCCGKTLVVRVPQQPPGPGQGDLEDR